MKLKYYLRGLGIGVLVSVIIMTVAFGNRKPMTDEEIKARAKELGMIENSVLADMNKDDTQAAEDIKESEERKKRMSEFEGLTFNQITKKFVKENLNASITDEQIADVLLND